MSPRLPPGVHPSRRPPVSPLPEDPSPAIDPRNTLTHEGTISRVIADKGFGFIFCPLTGQEYFFHVSELENCSSIDQVKRGMGVRFIAGSSLKGPRATSVTIDLG